MTRSMAAPILGRRTRVTTSVKSRRPTFDQRKRRSGYGNVVIIGLGGVSDDFYCRHRREDDEGAMDVDEEDEVDSIMDEDEDEPEPSEAGEEEEHTEEVDGDEEGATPKSKGKKKSGRKSELDNMAALTDEQA